MTPIETAIVQYVDEEPTVSMRRPRLPTAGDFAVAVDANDWTIDPFSDGPTRPVTLTADELKTLKDDGGAFVPLSMF